MTQLVVILSLQEDRVESKAFCCMLHALEITNYISALGMRLNWDDNRYEVERWFLTRDSWTCTLAMSGNGALFIPSTLRVWVPFRLCEVYWNAGTEMFFVSLRFCARSTADGFIDRITDFANDMVGNAIGNDGRTPSSTIGSAAVNADEDASDPRGALHRRFVSDPTAEPSVTLHRRYVSDPVGSAAREPLLRPVYATI